MIFRSDSPNRSKKRIRVTLNLDDTIAYVIGDVHGCFDELKSLENNIVEDASPHRCKKLIIMLGDYIDRGPKSAKVIDHLVQRPPQDFKRICLLGNHEEALIDFLESKISLESWLLMGAGATLSSYGIDHTHLTNTYQDRNALAEAVKSALPPAHLNFLLSLPILAVAANTVFAHAGIRPGVALEKQTAHDLLYIREDLFKNQNKLDCWLVHGHTPINHLPKLEGRRLNIDTGAFKTGRLTAARLWGQDRRLLFS